MIVTEKFVMLAFPKTGSSFVRRNLKQIHDYNTLPRKLLRRLGIEPPASMQELILPAISMRVPPRERSRHAFYCQIPEEHRHKTIASCVRNPFDRYVSLYLFGRWKAFYPLMSDAVWQAFPNFPDLSFEEYYELIHSIGRDNRLDDISPKTDLGIYSIQFIRFHFKDSTQVLATIDDDYIRQGRYRQDMAEIVFLHQENLNRELYEFLVRCDYPPEKVSYLLEAEKVNVTPRTPQDRRLEAFYTPELVAQILKRDRLLFELFPQYQKNLPQ